MKKVIIAAVAATMASVSMADISMTGSALYHIRSVDNGTTSVAPSDRARATTEVDLSIKGTSGSSTVNIDIALDSTGNNDEATAVENAFITTKVGGVDLKLGNYSTPTTGLLGEIDNGGRSYGKWTASKKIGGVKVYAGQGGRAATDADTDDGVNRINDSAFVGVSAAVKGFTLQLKKANKKETHYGVAGKVGPASIRYEASKHKDANANRSFAEVKGAFGIITVGYAQVKTDSLAVYNEDDSTVFADSASGMGVDKTQLMVSGKIAGNTISAFSGKLKNAADVKRGGYTKLELTRPLAAGSKLVVYHKSSDIGVDAATANKTKTIGAKFSVKF